MKEEKKQDTTVRVCVRVRPFTKREIDQKADCIVKMEGRETTITDPVRTID